MKRIELARELQCSPSTITKLIEKGMPKQPDGDLDRGVCLQWIVKFTSGKDGGWNEGNRGAGVQERAQKLLADSGGESAHRKPAGPGPVTGSTEFLRGAEWMAM